LPEASKLSSYSYDFVVYKGARFETDESRVNENRVELGNADNIENIDSYFVAGNTYIG